MTPSLATINPTTPAHDSDPIPPVIEPIRGTAARQLAEAQGHVWGGIAETVAVVEHAQSFEIVDAQGDKRMAALMRLLMRARAMARQERAVQTEAMLVEVFAHGVVIIELDAHEDAHVREMREHGTVAGSRQRRASTTIGGLLGQKDALCGRVKRPTDQVVYRACQQPAGHNADGRVCVFEAVLTAPASLP